MSSSKWNQRIKKDPENRGNEGAEQGGGSQGVDGYFQYSNTEGGHQGAAANAVYTANDTDTQGKKGQGQGVNDYRFVLEVVVYCSAV